MTTDTEAPKRKRRELPPGVRIEPILLSHENAAAVLGQISERSLDSLVAEGRIRKRQLLDGRVAYLRSELEAFAASLPVVTPGLPDPQGGRQGA